MASTLYQEIFEKGEARGYARGEAKVYVEVITVVLIHRLGPLDADLRARIQSVSDLDTLRVWKDEALLVRDVDGAERLAERIRKARLSEA